MDNLVLHYPKHIENNLPISWAYYENDACKSTGQAESLKELSDNEFIKTKNNLCVYAWISGELVSLRQVPLPKSQHRYRQTIIPQLLEDEVNEDIEDLHFVCGRRIDEHTINIAIIQKQVLKTIINDFKQNGFTLHCLLPDSLCLDYQTDQWSFYQDTQASQLRIAPQIAYHFDTLNMEFYLNKFDPQADTNINIIQSNANQLISFPWEHCKINEQGSTLNRTKLPEQKLLSINLLQDQYATAANWLKYWQQWKTIVYLGFAAILINLLSIYIETLDMEEQALSYKSQSRQLFRTTFPHEKRIVNIKAQVQQQITKLQQGDQQSLFFELLSAISPVLANSPKIELKTLNYDQANQQLQLYIQSSSFALIEQFNTQLNQSEIYSETGSISGQKGKYMAKISISTSNLKTK